MVLRGKPRGRVGRCRIFFEAPRVAAFDGGLGAFRFLQRALESGSWLRLTWVRRSSLTGSSQASTAAGRFLDLEFHSRSALALCRRAPGSAALRRRPAMKKPTVFGKYLLLERINVGGMAEVFIAKAFGVEGFERILAIKRILPTMAEDEEFITMFIDEARISVQLNHANIVHIHELGKHDDTLLHRDGVRRGQGPAHDPRALPASARRSMPIAHGGASSPRKMCEGLDYAHRKKDARGQDLDIIHRDVSPQNILVSLRGRGEDHRLRHRQGGEPARRRRRPASSRASSAT